MFARVGVTAFQMKKAPYVKRMAALNMNPLSSNVIVRTEIMGLRNILELLLAEGIQVRFKTRGSKLMP